jgi:hypothetical protein
MSIAIAEFPPAEVTPIHASTLPAVEVTPKAERLVLFFWVGCATMVLNVVLFAVWLNHVLRLESL